MTRFIYVFVFLALIGFAQQDAMLDCEAPGSLTDPRCQYSTRQSSQTLREELTLPRIPVIRDSGNAQPEMDRPQRTASPAPLTNSVPPTPQEPTEFQRFVQEATGRLLPVFGEKLFQQAPSTFAPVDRAPVTPDYVVGPGDQLLIRGWGQIDLSVSPVVDRSGNLYIPQIGELNVAGLQFSQMQDYLKTAVGRVYRNFDLSVNMGQLRSIQVFVVGHARKPGVYTLSALSTLVNAIFASGGPDSQGSMRRIRLTRAREVVTEFDLYDLLLLGDKSKDARLMPGDVIYIPPIGPQIALSGSVNTPAVYEMKEGGVLAEALQLAGGLTPTAEKRNAFIERIGSSGRSVVQVSLEADKASTVKLQNGDVINVRAIVPRFENTVTLRGNVADPVRMPWYSGMKVRDLIPDREALLTRDYWRAHNRLPLTREPENAPGGEAMPVSSGSAGRNVDITPLALSAPATYTREVRAPSESQSKELKGGTPSSIAAVRRESAGAKNRVERNSLEVNWSYAVIERRDPKDLRVNLIPFNLGKAIIARDEDQNLALEPGDVVTIFSTADLRVPQAMQTRYVRLEGEFEAAGVYSVRPGETLRQLVARAGGLTPDAYLFGSEFLRESSKEEQQQRLDDFVNSLERQVESAAANVRGSVISPEEAAAASSQASSQRELVAKLRDVRATGRIVLNLDPNAPGENAIPDMALEDGDVFVVPSKPAFVNVVGSVYNGTSFLYDSRKRVGDYLKESGKPTRTADSRHIFLIRADGSVVSKGGASSVVHDSFESLRLNPGDTIVVPEQINKTTFLKSLKDWSQIFAQFGLGAAAINVLK